MDVADSGASEQQVARETPALLFPGQGEMARRTREFDWSQTPIGPIESWPQSLKTAVNLILNSQHPMWIGWGEKTTFLYNDAYIDVLSIAKHPWALGRPAAEVWSEIWDVCGPLVEKVFQKNEASFFDDVRLFMNRGDFLEETYYSFSYSPIQDETGKTAGLFCPSADVTGQVLNARRLRTLSELSGSALLEKTVEGACFSASYAFSKNPDDVPFALLYLYGAGRREMQLKFHTGFSVNAARSIPAAVDSGEGTSQSAPWPVSEVANSGSSNVFSVADVSGLPHGPAQQKVVEAIALPVRSPGESLPIGVLIAGINPTRRLDAEYLTFYELIASHVGTAIANARAYEEERKRSEALAELDRAKTTFFSNISHELRTPLTLVLGPTEAALASADRTLGGAELEMIHRNELRLLKLVNTLLDFSRIEAGRVQANFEPTDLAEFTKDLASIFRSATERAGLQLLLDCSPLPRPVYVDREMWEKIVLNLVSNAFKSTFAGEISISLRALDAHVNLEVRDTGTGIAQEEIPYLFERFRRIEGATRRSHEGSGIGLALVHELVKLHNGSIHVESELGKGTTFTVSIPQGAPSVTKAPPKAQPTHAVPKPTATPYLAEALSWLPGEGPLQGLAQSPHELLESTGNRLPGGNSEGRVLVADDNPDMRDYVRRLLSERFEVFTAANGKDALDLAAADSPDLVITDVMMPEMDGLQLLAALRANPKTNTIPVILLSARAGDEARIEGVRQGADDYLGKPFSARELLARVHTHIDLARLRKQAVDTVRAREEELRILHTVGSTLASELDLKKLVQVVTDAGRELSEAEFGAFFYNVVDASGEKYMLYTLSGAREEAFSKFPMPRNTAVFAPTFAGDETVRVDDITKDSRYGKSAPYHGMPPGHLPVRSYLAVPIVSRSGEVLGGLFYGHSQPGVFSEKAERLVEGIATQAAIAIDNARLFETVKLEKAHLQESQERLRKTEKLAAAGQLAASLAHEINNPLSSVTNALYLLKSGDGLQPEAKNLVDIASGELARMSRIVKQSLSYYRAGSVPKDVDIAALVAESLQVFGSKFERAGIVVAQTLVKGNSVQGFSDEIRQVIDNLLLNAAEAMPRGGRLLIAVSPSRDWTRGNRKGIRLTVSDSGSGIPRNIIPKIFEPFFTTKPERGTGLGLWVVRGLVAKHDGTIRVRSSDRTARSGTTISILWPTDTRVQTGGANIRSGLTG